MLRSRIVYSGTRSPGTGLVGTELSQIIPRLFKVAAGCAACDRYAAKLNRWGIDGCEARFDRIVARLVIRSRRKAFVKYFPGVCEVVATRWLREAIEKAKQSPSIPVPVSKPATVVWVYWEAGAAREELRYSMRSAIRNLSDVANVVICGDRPKWYKGEFIRSPRFSEAESRRKFGTDRFTKWVDSIVKLRKIIDSPIVTDNFLWLYDDTFVLRPTSIAALSVPRAGRFLREKQPKQRGGNTWRVVQYRTAMALRAGGFPTRNFSTHYPAVYEKSKLLQTIEHFECDSRPRLIESLYGNHHFTNVGSTAGVFQYRRRPPKNWKPDELSTIVNAGVFTRSLQDEMQRRFPEPCDLERALYNENFGCIDTQVLTSATATPVAL